MSALFLAGQFGAFIAQAETQLREVLTDDQRANLLSNVAAAQCGTSYTIRVHRSALLE
jgi:hypothetical protein